MQFLSAGEIVLRTMVELWPAWAKFLVLVLGLSIAFSRRLGLYGHVVRSGVGFVGLALVGFWLFVAIFGRAIMPFYSAPARSPTRRTRCQEQSSRTRGSLIFSAATSWLATSSAA